ncbi:MAG: hypothetical protein HQL37_10190 [Alphaproteobacteria bacterium]|nr:hypothetical protein [Alphaproteobacteria bacterium]
MNTAVQGGGAGMTLAVVRFTAGGTRFAAEARHVRFIHDIPFFSDGAGILRIESLLGPLASNPVRRRGLVVETATGETVVSVCEPVFLDTLDAKTIFPMPPLIAARLSLKGVRALAMDESGLILLVDLPLLSSRRAKDGQA